MYKIYKYIQNICASPVFCYSDGLAVFPLVLLFSSSRPDSSSLFSDLVVFSSQNNTQHTPTLGPGIAGDHRKS